MQRPSSDKRDFALWHLLPIGIFWVWFTTNQAGDWGVDIWLYLATGKLIVNHGIPSNLVFTFGEAAQMPYFAHEWLSSTVFYAVQQAAGLQGLEVFRHALALALFFSLFHLYNTIVRNKVSALLIAGIVIYMASWRLLLRAELFAYISFALSLSCFARFQTSKQIRHLLFVFPIMLIWVNSHGSYLLGFLLPPLYWIGAVMGLCRKASFKTAQIDPGEILRASRPYLLIWLGVLICGLCNPYGFSLWRHSLELSFDPFIPTIIYEWKPTLSYLNGPALTPYFYMVALVALAVATSAKRLSLPSWLLLAAFGYLSLSAIRHIYLFMFIAGVILSEAARGRFDDRLRQRGLYAASLAAIFLIAAPAFIEAGGPRALFTKPYKQHRTLSEASIQFIKASQISGPMINDYALGNYLIFRLFPRITVSMDSRIDAFGKRLLEQNLAAMNGNPDVFPNSPQHMIANAPRSIHLAQSGFLQRNPEWRVVYQDESATLFSRDRSLWPGSNSGQTMDDPTKAD
jgi:hypothetical protein